MDTPDRLVIADTRLLAMTRAVSNLHAQLCELNELRERVRKAELARSLAAGRSQKKSAHSTA
jgi:hypothetical protein